MTYSTCELQNFSAFSHDRETQSHTPTQKAWLERSVIANRPANLRASAGPGEHKRAKSELARETTTLLRDVGK